MKEMNINFNFTTEKKAFDEAKKTEKKKKRWNGRVKIDGYDVIFWALPIFPIFYGIEKFKDWNYRRMAWSEKRADRVLNDILPKALEWVEEDNAFYFCMQWGEGIYWRRAKRADRKWAKKFCYKIKSYLEDEYENAQYTKTVERDYYETWIKFVEK